MCDDKYNDVLFLGKQYSDYNNIYYCNTLYCFPNFLIDTFSSISNI